MKYVWMVLAGIVGAAAAALTWLFVALGVTIGLPLLMSSLGNAGSGSSGVLLGSRSMLAAALIGFAGGCVWHARRPPRP